MEITRKEEANWQIYSYNRRGSPPIARQVAPESESKI